MSWTLGLLPLLLLLLGFPIFLVLIASATVALLLYTSVPLTQLHLTIYGSIDQYSLLAIPFFIFAGELMARGDISQRLIEWVQSLFGGVRGSLAVTAVGTNVIFGAITGSSLAAVAAVGRLLYRPLNDAGYGERFSVGLLTSSGAMAIVIPPSITMILYGAVAEQSVAKLFIAGIIPGFLIAVILTVYILFAARARGVSSSGRFDLSGFLRATRRAVWSLGTPVIILGGIYLGVFSPTEAAGVACVYAIIVTLFVHRSIDLHGIWQVTLSTVYLTAQILIVVAAAGAYAWLLTTSGLPQQLASYIAGLEIEPWQMLLVLNVLLLLVGCFLDPASAILVLTPLLLPIVRQLGIDPIHFGVIFSVNLSIGMFTPPFGLNIFAAQSVFGTRLATIYRGIAPFILLNLIALLLVTYLPELSLLLPRFVD